MAQTNFVSANTPVAAPKRGNAITAPTGSGTAYYIPLWTTPTTLGNSSIFDNAGNIGIGTLKPIAPLDVRNLLTIGSSGHGQLIFDPVGSGWGGYGFQLSPGDLTIAASSNVGDGINFRTTFAGVSLVHIRTGSAGQGNVGIGTANPTAKLDIVGSAKFEGVGNGIIFPDGTIQNTAIVRGPQGVAGAQGAQGPQGTQGPPGTVPPGANANLGFNLNPGTSTNPNFPHPFESDPGWGGGAQPAQIVDGFRGCNAGDGWSCGLAFTGGNANWGGQQCGVRQATIDLGDSPMQVSGTRVTHHGDDQVPKIYQIQTLHDGQWTTEVSITNNSQARCIRAPSYDPTSTWTCMITDEFFPVQTTKVRYTFNNCPGQNSNILGQSITHGWIWEFEVYKLPI